MPPPVRRTLDGQLADILTRLGILETRPRGGSGGGGSTAWGDITGKPPTFPPSAHTHPSSQITDFATAVPAAMPAASDTVAGKVELATDLETQVGTDGARAVTPLSLNSRTATEGRTGLVELATSAETAAGSDATRAITPAGLLGRTATEARIGLAEIATTAEVTTGTDDTRFVTPLKLKQAITAIPATPPATETTAGLVELATSAETIAGTDATRAVTPAGLAAAQAAIAAQGSTALRDATFGVPSTSAERVALANRVVAWFNTDKGWTETYYATTGLSGLVVPGVSSDISGWRPVGSGEFRLIPGSVGGGSCDARGQIVPTGSSPTLDIDNVFTPDFRKYRITGKLTTTVGTRISAQFLRLGDGGPYNTAGQYWQGLVYAQGGFSSAIVHASNSDPGGFAGVGVSGSAAVLGHSFDLVCDNPYYAAHTQLTGSFGFHGGAVGAGTLHGGLETTDQFRGIRFTTFAGNFSPTNSNVTVYGLL